VEKTLDKLDAEALQAIDEAVEFAKSSDDPTYEDLISHVYVD